MKIMGLSILFPAGDITMISHGGLWAAFFVVNRIIQPSQLFIESGEALDYGSGLGQQRLNLGFSVGR